MEKNNLYDGLKNVIIVKSSVSELCLASEESEDSRVAPRSSSVNNICSILINFTDGIPPPPLLRTCVCPAVF